MRKNEIVKAGALAGALIGGCAAEKSWYENVQDGAWNNTSESKVQGELVTMGEDNTKLQPVTMYDVDGDGSNDRVIVWSNPEEGHNITFRKRYSDGSLGIERDLFWSREFPTQGDLETFSMNYQVIGGNSEN